MPDSSVRASDADRDATAAALREHLLAGRITMDEFEERIGAAYSARTVDELAQLTNDLSSPPQPVAAAEPERRRRKRRQERSEKQQSSALASWQARRDAQAKLLELARQYRGESWPDFVCKPGEAVFAKVTSTQLIEDRRQPGRYEGRSSGVSIPLGLGVRYRTGGSRGRYVQGASVPTAIDVGTLYITNKRVVFRGAKQTRECVFDKTIGISHDARRGMAVVSVSNRQKPMVVSYGPKVAPWVGFRMDLALAHFKDQVPGVVARLEQQLAEIDRDRPLPRATPQSFESPVTVKHPISETGMAPPPGPLLIDPAASQSPSPSHQSPPELCSPEEMDVLETIHQLDVTEIRLQRTVLKLTKDALEALEEQVTAQMAGKAKLARTASKRGDQLAAETNRVLRQIAEVSETRERMSNALRERGVEPEPPDRAAIWAKLEADEHPPVPSRESTAPSPTVSPPRDHDIGWGVLLLASELAAALAAHESEYKRYLRGGAVPTGQPVLDPLSYYLRVLDRLGEAVRPLERLMGPEVCGRAIGPEGCGGDEAAVKETVTGLAAIYSSLIALGLEMRGAMVPHYWQAAAQAFASISELPLARIREFSEALSARAPEHVAALRGGRFPARPLNLMLTLDLDADAALDEVRKIMAQ